MMNALENEDNILDDDDHDTHGGFNYFLKTMGFHNKVNDDLW